MNDCPRLNKWIRGCKFEPRYVLLPPTEETMEVAERHHNYDAGDLKVCPIAVHTHDICVRCGKTVKRNANVP